LLRQIKHMETSGELRKHKAHYALKAKASGGTRKRKGATIKSKKAKAEEE
jgi:hypothetical protein